MRRITLTLAAAAFASLSLVNAATFRVTIENYGPQPLSPLFWSASNENFDIFQLGGEASLGIENIAEGGNTAAMLAIAAAAGSDVSAYGALPGGPVMPGNSRTGFFTTTETHEYFSFPTMLGMTNDAFFGESFSTSSLSLFSNGAPQGFSMLLTGLRAWDAGTEENTQSSADVGAFGGSGSPLDTNRAIRIHDTIIPGIGDLDDDLPDWARDTALGRLTVEVVPEPASLSVLGLGALALLRRRRK